MIHNYMHNQEEKIGIYNLIMRYPTGFYTPGLGIVYLVATSLVFMTDA